MFLVAVKDDELIVYIIVVNIIPNMRSSANDKILPLKISFVQSTARTKQFHRWWKNVLKVTSPFRRCVKKKNKPFGKWPREGLLMFARWKSRKTMFNVTKNFRLFVYAFHRPICTKWLIFSQIPHEKENLSTYEISTWQHRNILYDFYSFVDSYHKSHSILVASFSILLNSSQLWNKNRVSVLSMM